MSDTVGEGLAARVREELKAIGARPRREWLTGLGALSRRESVSCSWRPRARPIEKSPTDSPRRSRPSRVTSPVHRRPEVRASPKLLRWLPLMIAAIYNWLDA